MRKTFDYLVQGFGYLDGYDLLTSLNKMSTIKLTMFAAITSISLGTIRAMIENAIGLDIVVIGGFVWLILAEWQTGLKVARTVKNEKFQSRKFGRMILKIAVYINILVLLHAFATRTKTLSLGDFFEVNPLAWLYYTVFIAIMLQLLISYLENLAALGYKEAKGLVGIILRKYNKWFEFDGEKDGDKFVNQ